MSYDKKRTVVIASKNPGKIAEMKAILPDNLTILSLEDFPEIQEVEETGTTFQENSLIKSKTIAMQTGLVAIADDSGLEVDALNGEPGIYSARYSGLSGSRKEIDKANNDLILEKLKWMRQEKRTARFIAAITACTPDKSYITAEGKWEGFIGNVPKGRNGFAYDLIFLDAGSMESAASLEPAEKNKRSHRKKALDELMRLWPIFKREWDSDLFFRGNDRLKR